MEKDTSFAQAGQDLFALEINKRSRFKTFVDIGAGDPVLGSNTFMLEKDFEWHGIAAEKDAELIGKWSKRSAHLYHDAFDPSMIAAMHMMAEESGRIDFLSLDLEPPDLTLEYLNILPFDRIRFTALCVEHDAYRVFGWKRKREMANLLEKHGYVCVCDNVLMLAMGDDGFQLVPVEDWWVDPLEVDLNTAHRIASEIRMLTESRMLTFLGKVKK